jgi:hypothetical protein
MQLQFLFLKEYFSFEKYGTFYGNSSICDLIYIFFVLFYLGDVEKSFVCSSEGYSEYNEIIKLFLSSGNMVRPLTARLQSSHSL